MAESRTNNIAAPVGLEQQVEALLNDVQSALTDVQQRLGDENAPPTEAPKGNQLLTDDGVTEAATPAEEVPAAAEAELEPTAEADSAVGTLDPLGETAAELSGVTPAQEVESSEQERPSEEDLSAQLAADLAATLAQTAVSAGDHTGGGAEAPAEETHGSEPVVAAAADELDAELAAAIAAENAAADAIEQKARAQVAAQSTAQNDQDLAAVLNASGEAAKEFVPEPAAAENPKLDQAVKSMLDDAAAAIAAKQREAADLISNLAAAGPANLEDLDSQLASLTEQMLNEPAATGVPLPAAPVPVAPAAAAQAHATAATAAAAAAATSTQTPQGATVVESAKDPATTVSLKQRVLELLVKSVGLASKPLDSQPRVVRDTLGWVALVTLFWAGTIWVYFLFFHKPVASEIPENAPRLSTGEHAHAAKHDDDGDSYAAKSAQSGSKSKHGGSEVAEKGAKSEHAERSTAHAAEEESSEHGGHEPATTKHEGSEHESADAPAHSEAPAGHSKH